MRLARFLAFLAAIFVSPAFAAGDLAVVQAPVTISAGASLSASVDLGPNRPFGIIVPAGWTAASITFQASADGINFFNVFDDTGAELTLVAAASEYLVFSSPAKILGLRWIKLRSGTSGTPVNQVSSAALIVVGVP